jgi:hypothetical protein
MPWITLPPGCRRLTFADGSKPAVANWRGRAEVTESQAKMIDSMRGNGEGGLIHGQAGEYGVTGKAGRWCQDCRRLWYAWAIRCPRCGTETTPE